MLHPDFDITPETNSCFSAREMAEIIEKLDNSELSMWVNSVTAELDQHVLEMPEMDIDDLNARVEVI